MKDHITGKATFNKTIEVIVAPDGSSKVETKGFSGGECRDASRYLEQALGTSQQETLTSDFYQTGSEKFHLPERN